MNLRRAIAMLLVLAVPALAARGDTSPPFEVIVSPATPEQVVSREFLAEVFLKKVTRWDDGTAARPVDREPGSVLRQRFSDEVLERPVDAVQSYWQQLIFSGRGLPPPELTSDDDVVSYVVAHPGAVGYVRDGTQLRGAHLVRVR